MAATNTSIAAGMTVSINGQLYRVESSVKVTVPKGTPFLKTKLRDLHTNELIEKTFKPNQTIQEVMLIERTLEYLYLESSDYLFLDINNLEQVLVPASIIGSKSNYLKEGIEITAQFYGDTIFTVELPQFLELMVTKTTEGGEQSILANATKPAVLETGAQIEVPLFIDVGDIVKVDTRTDDYIQRV
jgi:elongation factor P